MISSVRSANLRRRSCCIHVLSCLLVIFVDVFGWIVEQVVVWITVLQLIEHRCHVRVERHGRWGCEAVHCGYTAYTGCVHGGRVNERRLQCALLCNRPPLTGSKARRLCGSATCVGCPLGACGGSVAVGCPLSACDGSVAVGGGSDRPIVAGSARRTVFTPGCALIT